MPTSWSRSWRFSCSAALQPPSAARTRSSRTTSVNNQVYSAGVRDDNVASGGLQALDLRSAAVGTSEVANGSLTGSDILNGSLGTADIATLPAAEAGSSVNQTVLHSTW